MHLGPWEIVLIFVVILLIFGGKKLPEFARSLRQALNEFKETSDEIKQEIDSTEKNIKDTISEEK